MVYPGEAYREDMGTLSDGRITVHIGLRTCCADCMLNWASEQKSHRRRRFSWIFACCCERVNSNMGEPHTAGQRRDEEMKILVINSGSSSLKFQVIDSDSEQVMARGVCERIGIDGIFNYKTDKGIVLKEEVSMPDHKAAVNVLLKTLVDKEKGVLPFRWVGRRTLPLFLEGGLDIDHDYGIAQTEYWLRKHGFSEKKTPYENSEEEK